MPSRISKLLIKLKKNNDYEIKCHRQKRHISFLLFIYSMLRFDN